MKVLLMMNELLGAVSREVNVLVVSGGVREFWTGFRMMGCTRYHVVCRYLYLSHC